MFIGVSSDQKAEFTSLKVDRSVKNTGTVVSFNIARLGVGLLYLQEDISGPQIQNHGTIVLVGIV